MRPTIKEIVFLSLWLQGASAPSTCQYDRRPVTRPPVTVSSELLATEDNCQAACSANTKCRAFVPFPTQGKIRCAQYGEGEMGFSCTNPHFAFFKLACEQDPTTHYTSVSTAAPLPLLSTPATGHTPDVKDEVTPSQEVPDALKTTEDPFEKTTQAHVDPTTEETSSQADEKGPAGQWRIKSEMTGLYLRVNSLNAIELGEPGLQDSQWSIAETEDKVLIVFDSKFLRENNEVAGILSLSDSVEAFELWKAVANGDGTWSFESNRGRWMSDRERGSVRAVVMPDLKVSERFRLEAW